jgi:hypothetical protein
MWTGSDHDNDRIDRAIDDVARRMTEGAPSADLKARVLSRLDRLESAASWRWRLVWIAAPLAAAAAVIFMVFAARFDRGSENRGSRPAVARGSDQPLPPTMHQEPAQKLNRLEEPRPRAAATVARTGVAPAPRSLPTPSDVEALAPPQLEVPSIALPSMAIGEIPTTSIAIDPLETITPIAVTPIGEGDRQ